MIWIIFLAFIIGDAFFNHWHENKDGIIHWVNASYRLAFGEFLVIAFGLHGWKIVFLTSGCFFSFWLIFNPLLNRLDGRAFWYLGKTAVLDRMESKYSKIPWPFFKFVFAFLSIIAYYKLA